MELSTVLRNPGYFEPYLVPKNATHIVFTDQPAPKGVRKYDVSKAQDKGVVRWKDGDTYYFSTQRPGVKVVAPEISTYLFSELEKLATIEASMLDVSNVKRMDGMFLSCKSLKNVDGLASWDVSNVTSMDDMFLSCKSLENVDGLAKWDVGNVIPMKAMFCGYKSLENVDGLVSWDVGNVTTMKAMFCDCPNLTTAPAWYHDDSD
jgi:surface protein